MNHKLIVSAFIGASLTFFSCNRTEEKKAETTTSPDYLKQQDQKPLAPELIAAQKRFAADTTNYEIRTMLAVNYYSAGDMDNAIYHFNKVVEHDSKNLIALANLGNIYYDVKQDDKAIEYYEKALELDPKNIDMRCDLATCYMNINKLKKAIKILKENIEMNPKHEKSHHNLAVILKQNGDIKESEDEMKIYESLKITKK
jgi:superkiller protein 3